jgi:hypothetical protein
MRSRLRRELVAFGKLRPLACGLSRAALEPRAEASGHGCVLSSSTLDAVCYLSLKYQTASAKLSLVISFTGESIFSGTLSPLSFFTSASTAR